MEKNNNFPETIKNKCILLLKKRKAFHWISYNQELQIIQYTDKNKPKIEIVYRPLNKDPKKVFRWWDGACMIDYHEGNFRWIETLNHELYKACGKENIGNFTSS